MIALLLGVMASVFVVIAVGWLWVRSGQPFDNRLVSGLVGSVGTPCLVLRTFDQRSLDMAAFADMAAAATLMVGIAGALGAVALTLLRMDVREYLPALMFPNVANMGLPVVLFVFGETGLALAIVVLIVHVVAHNTVGIAVAARRLPLTGLLRLPVFPALVIGIALAATGWHLPQWLARSVDLLANLTIPLMLLALGATLARLQVMRLAVGALVTGLRLAIGLVAALLGGWALGLDPMAHGVLILQGTMPVAVLSYLYAERYGTGGEAMAGAVMVSTLAALLTVPLMVWLVTQG